MHASSYGACGVVRQLVRGAGLVAPVLQLDGASHGPPHNCRTSFTLGAANKGEFNKFHLARGTLHGPECALLFNKHTLVGSMERQRASKRDAVARISMPTWWLGCFVLSSTKERCNHGFNRSVIIWFPLPHIGQVQLPALRPRRVCKQPKVGQVIVGEASDKGSDVMFNKNRWVTAFKGCFFSALQRLQKIWRGISYQYSFGWSSYGFARYSCLSNGPLAWTGQSDGYFCSMSRCWIKCCLMWHNRNAQDGSENTTEMTTNSKIGDPSTSALFTLTSRDGEKPGPLETQPNTNPEATPIQIWLLVFKSFLFIWK